MEGSAETVAVGSGSPSGGVDVSVIDCTGSLCGWLIGIPSTLPLPFPLSDNEGLLDLGKEGAGEFHLSHEEDALGLTVRLERSMCGASSRRLGAAGEVRESVDGRVDVSSGADLEGPAIACPFSPSSTNAMEAILPPLVLTVRSVALLPLLLRRPICRPPRSPSSCLRSVSSDVRPPSVPDTRVSANTSEIWVDVGFRPEGVRRDKGAFRREEGLDRTFDRGAGADDIVTSHHASPASTICPSGFDQCRNEMWTLWYVIEVISMRLLLRRRTDDVELGGK